MRHHWPVIDSSAREAGRPRPWLAAHVHVRFDAAAESGHNVGGSARQMIDQVLAFEKLGTDELVVGLPAVRPDDVRRAAERFQREVVEPFRQELEARRNRLRDEYSM